MVDRVQNLGDSMLMLPVGAADEETAVRVAVAVRIAIVLVECSSAKVLVERDLRLMLYGTY